ncbi:glycoside hydrolase family 2 TIM barrel-domain containing protein [Termitidicoccus mucosus]
MTTIGLLAAFSLFAGEDSGDARRSLLFNFGWKFRAGDVEGAQAAAYNDSDWRAVDLPHDFQIEQPWEKSARGARGFKKMGAGWYRKSFRADPDWRGKRVLLDFEGIMLTGDVWLNGTRVGGTDYGYLGFEADITKYINYEGENVIAVRADTGMDGNSRWYTGGGLYRDVHLLVKNEIAVARHGVFVTTPEVSERNAEVGVQVEVEGLRGKQLQVDIEAKLYAPGGRLVAETRQSAPKKSKKLTVEIALPAMNIETPQLWSCETPHLYTAVVTLALDGKIVDRVTEAFGIRHIEFSPGFGFKLNGKKIILKGIANHHDLGAVGAAAYERAIERQFETLKAFGFNHVRTSHNPYSESFLRLADKHGILIVDELFDKWSQQYAGGRIPWMMLWPAAVAEWIKRDRNHPSVIMWSFGNELQVREEWTGFPTGDWGVTGYRILDVLAKRHDPTRKTTVAMFPARKNAVTKEDPSFNVVVEPPELSVVTDIASYNYRYPAFPKYAEQFPHLILYQSEAATSEMGKAYYGMDLGKVVGLAYWGAIEYWGESRGWPAKGWNYSFFDHSLEPLPQAYFVKSMFDDTPLVRIGVVDREAESIEWNDVMVGQMPMSSHWNRASGARLNLVTYTNAEEVELFINGKSFGVQKNIIDDPARRNAIFWKDVPYREGGVVAVARNGGGEVARHQLETTDKAVALRLEAETGAWRADGLDLQYMKVRAVDREGREVPDAAGEVTFEVSGAARLIAVDNGDHRSDELFAGNKRMLHNGRALAILRAGLVPGEVTITASVPGLKSAKKRLMTTGQ